MRIAVFIKSTTFHKGYGGLETQNRALCEELVTRGHDILVFSPQHELRFETKYENGVKYHFVPCVYRLARFNKENWFFKSYEIFSKFHKGGPFDLVVSQSSAGLGVSLKKKKQGVPVISISHGSILGELKTRFQTVDCVKDYGRLLKDLPFVVNVFFGRQRQFIHASNRIIAVSSSVKKAIVNETFISPEKVAVVNNGIDPSKIGCTKPMTFSSKATDGRVLYVGQVIKSKGVETLLELSKETKFSGVSFDLIGGGDFLEKLQKIVRKDRLPNFHLYGKMPYEQVLSYFKDPSVSLFAFPTRREEGFPMVLVEAMFVGLPIVVYDMGGVRDAVFDGETGFLVAPGDYAEFKNKILELLQNSDLRAQMNAKSLEYAKKNFTINKMVDDYEQVFKEVLS